MSDSSPAPELLVIGQDEADGAWQPMLATAARSVKELAERGLIPHSAVAILQKTERTHRVYISEYYLGLMDPEDPDCPIRAQAIPTTNELESYPWDEPDPIGDDIHRIHDILIHRYPNRVLLLPTHICPMYCRYCFRKVSLNSAPVRLQGALPAALGYIADNPNISEVILSGGDPLMLSDRRLKSLIAELSTMEHVKRIRIHSRTPVTFPHRMTPDLVEALTSSKEVVIVTHFNHPKELTETVRRGLDLCSDQGLRLANQSVLLKGVNDDPNLLYGLCSTLGSWGVRPYYLHHLDAAPGTQHFRIPLSRGLEIYRAFSSRLAGLDRPRYMLEIPGGGGKVDVDSSSVTPLGQPGHYGLLSPLTGQRIPWFDPALTP
jgi:lysine 2,3-aminomutase